MNTLVHGIALALLPSVAAAQPCSHPWFGTLDWTVCPPLGYAERGPTQVASADLNGDALPDLVVALRDFDAVSLLYAKPGGAFHQFELIGVGARPEGVVVADLNSDARPDIATADRFDHTVTVLFANETGFNPPVTWPTDFGPTDITLGDVDADGLPDLITANVNASSITLLRNDGQGGFDVSHWPASDWTPSSLAAADITGDGADDVLVTDDGADTLSLLVALDGPAFAPPLTIPVGTEPQDVAAADVDGDSDPDVCVANIDDDTVTVLLNDAGSLVHHADLEVGPSLRALSLTDTDDDGLADLIVAIGDVAIYRSLGDGSFVSADLAESPPIRAIHVADLTGDGFPDVVTTHPYLVEARIILGAGDAAFVKPVEFAVENAHAVAAGDIDADGDVDLAVTSNALGDVVVATNDANAGFELKNIAELTPFLIDIELADLDLDLDLDVIVVHLSASQIHVLRNDGDVFTPLDPVDTPAGPQAAAVADFNGDSLPDLGVSCVDDDSVAIFHLTETGFMLAQTIPVAEDPMGIAAADLDGDADNDLLVASVTGDVATVLLNDETTFSPGQSFQTQDGADIALADLDLDGDMDAAFADNNDGGARIYANDADANFSFKDSVPTTADATAVRLTDVDADGLPDLLIAAASIRVYHSIEPFVFEPPAIYSGFNAEEIVIADFDSDADADIATENIDVLLSVCATGVQCPADINADGTLNILDFVAFQLAWQSADPSADCNADAKFTILDFVCFQQLFQQGCV